MSVFFTFLGYTVFAVLQTVFLVVGIRHLLHHPVRLKAYQENYWFFAIALCYVLNLMEKIVAEGKNSRWFDMIIPLGNLSPFLFTLTFLALFLPEKWRGGYRAVAAVMCVGMTGAGFYNTITRIFSFNPWLYTCIVFDNFGHVLIGLYGFYVICNGIVTFDRKTKLRSCGFIFGTALLMVVLNAIFHTSFFGLNLYGHHNIYNLVLTKSSALSALIYFAGLTVVLASGWVITAVLPKARQTRCGEEGEA